MRKIPLETGKNPPAFLHLVSESPSALQVGPKVVGIYSRVVREAGAIFGTCHYPAFHFLVTCSDDFGYLGLEHLACSINGVRERDLLDASGSGAGWPTCSPTNTSIPGAASSGARPACARPNFQTPQKTRLLWVYEGLTEYLGEVLMVRSGMVDPAEYRRTLAGTIGSLMHHEGRRWRSLEDTAVASHLLRGGSPNWNELRRGQDYYFEGALIWLEADAIIRERSEGKKSLDDFCRKFLGVGTDRVACRSLRAAGHRQGPARVSDFDWERFLRDGRRSRRRRCRWRWSAGAAIASSIRRSAPSPPAGSRGAAPVGSRPAIRWDSASTPRARSTTSSPAWSAIGRGSAPGMKVIGVNGKKFSPQRLLDALAESVKSRKIDIAPRRG